ncbi:MAG: 3-phosphoshikimate 1-carboxyvinyltransferase [Betaproteobacteria bacterium]
MMRSDAPGWLDMAPVARLAGTMRLPGSKSISNRALLLAALSRGDTALEHLLESDDTEVMLGALSALGVEWHKDAEHVHRVSGCGGDFPVERADLFLGLSGLSLRTLAAALAMGDGHYRLDGVARMRERPIRDLVDALRPLGADIRYEMQDGYPPLLIGPKVDAGAARVRIRGDVSSQFLTGLLQALPLLQREAGVDVDGELISAPYVDITLDLMQRFGVEVERDGARLFRVGAGARYVSPGRFHVEGDASSASYFLAAGALGGPVRVEGVGRASVQGDVAFADVLASMGAQVTRGDNWIETRAGQALTGIDLDCKLIPDAAMTAAVIALFARGDTTLRNIGSWRVKETDRIDAMARELRKLGAAVEEGPDWLRVSPPDALRSATIDTYGDHRMAMCFSLATLGGVGVRINDPDCVRKTFPGYFDEFARLASARREGAT